MTFDPAEYYVFTSGGFTGAPVRGPWAEVLLDDLKRRGQTGSFRRVPAPEPYQYERTSRSTRRDVLAAIDRIRGRK